MAMANILGGDQIQMGQRRRPQFYNSQLDPQQNLQLASMLNEHLGRIQRQDQQGNADPGLAGLVQAMAGADAANSQNIAQKQAAQLQADTQGKVLAQQGQQNQDANRIKMAEYMLTPLTAQRKEASDRRQALMQRGYLSTDPEIMDVDQQIASLDQKYNSILGQFPGGQGTPAPATQAQGQGTPAPATQARGQGTPAPATQAQNQGQSLSRQGRENAVGVIQRKVDSLSRLPEVAMQTDKYAPLLIYYNNVVDAINHGRPEESVIKTPEVQAMIAKTEALQSVSAQAATGQPLIPPMADDEVRKDLTSHINSATDSHKQDFFDETYKTTFIKDITGENDPSQKPGYDRWVRENVLRLVDAGLSDADIKKAMADHGYRAIMDSNISPDNVAGWSGPMDDTKSKQSTRYQELAGGMGARVSRDAGALLDGDEAVRKRKATRQAYAGALAPSAGTNLTSKLASMSQ